MKRQTRILEELIAMFILLILLFSFEYVFFDLKHLKLGIPFFYGGDGLANTAYVKNVIENGWLSDTDRLSAPFSLSITAFTPLLFINTSALFYKICSFFSQNPFVIFNLRILLLPFFNGVSAYYALRKMRLSRVYSVAGALSFAVCFFVQKRLGGHVDLANCEAVPLGILFCYWCMHDEVPVRIKTMFRSKRTWLIILFSWLIANDGVGYYPFFTCFFLACIAAIRFFDTRKIKDIFPCCICIAWILFFFVLNFVPYFLSDTSEALTQPRALDDIERYGLRIAGLYLSPYGFGISRLENLYSLYFSNSILINENITEYLGVIGVLGSMILWIKLIQGKNTRVSENLMLENDLHWLSCLQMLGVVFATSAGFSMLFSLFVTSRMRTYNRISIFLQFICIFAFLLWCSKFDNKTIKKRLLALMMCIGTVVLTFIDFQVQPRVSSNTYQESLASDKEFFSDIEQMMDKDAMIYQLPYVPYPEASPRGDMEASYAVIPYLHTDSIKWSYGSTSAYADRWNSTIGNMSWSSMVDSLVFAGFSGVLVDSRAYSAEELAELTEGLANAADHDGIISSNGIYRFYPLFSVKEAYKSILDDVEWERATNFSSKLGIDQYGRMIELDDGQHVMINNGIYFEETDAEGRWRWFSEDASISLFAERSDTVTLHFPIEKTDDNAKLYISCGETKKTVEFSEIGNEMIITVPVHAGENVIRFAYEGKLLKPQNDPRELAFRLFYSKPSAMIEVSDYLAYAQE